jgi:hypothetical protein
MIKNIKNLCIAGINDYALDTTLQLKLLAQKMDFIISCILEGVIFVLLNEYIKMKH